MLLLLTGGCAAGMMSQPHGSANPLPQPRLIAERRWRLGSVTHEHPSGIMSKLMRFMASSQIAWKKGGPYNLKCRRVVHPQGTCPTTLQLLFWVL